MSHALRTRCKLCGAESMSGCPECGPDVDHGTWDTDTCFRLAGCPHASGVELHD